MFDPTKKEVNFAPVRTHWPILSVDYQRTDDDAGYGDAHFMDIGQATWNKEDLSAKIWRWADKGGRWSRQSEELPLSRVLDLAILVSAAATGQRSVLQEFYQRPEHKDALQLFLTENMAVFNPKLDELRRILQPIPQSIEKSGAPNIFSFATSELSQDAMFAWLLSWANPINQQNDPSLYMVASNFVKLLTGNENIAIKSVNAGRQWEHIDVWGEINDDIFLVIEDKTGTSIHDEQLIRYKNVVEEKYPNHKRYFVYLKTGNEPKSTLDTIQKSGYRIVLREHILKCIDAYSGDNVVLCNFRDHLWAHERATQSFRTKPVSEWNWNAWEGFYMELEERIGLNGWGYVANPSGGFIGAWWHSIGFSEGEMYLQFEEGKLCFKIANVIDRNRRSEIRNKCHKTLMEICQSSFPEIHKPSRFGAGEYMTIAIVNQDDLFGNTNIDIEKIVPQLNRYEKLVDKCCNVL